jgi:hypothetical protein
MNGMVSLIPMTWWRSEPFMGWMGRMAGPMLHAGKVRLTGRAPNGQSFIANPTRLWLIADSTAKVDGIDFGDIGPAPVQGELGDFRIPQQGVFAIGRAFFNPGPAPISRTS